MTLPHRVRPKLTRAFRRVHIVLMPARLLPGPFTVDAYRRLAELGILPDDARVELIDGQVIEMSPIGGPHASCVRRLTHLFGRYHLQSVMLDVQNPVVLDEHTAPQPDLALLRLRRDGYPEHPRATDVLLLIEVADTSLAYDRDVKIPRYAAAGIPEAWLVDLIGDSIHVCRQPGPDGYNHVVTLTRGQTLRPLLLPGVAIRADEILA